MSNYFSDVVCAGGCGNLLPQNLVDCGRRYLYGHKGGCPAEGAPVKKKKAGVTLVRTAATKAGPVTHTSYERTLAMAIENLQAAEAEFRSAQMAVQAANAREGEASSRYTSVHYLCRALVAVVDPQCAERARALELLGLSERTAVGKDAEVQA